MLLLLFMFEILSESYEREAKGALPILMDLLAMPVILYFHFGKQFRSGFFRLKEMNYSSGLLIFTGVK